MSLTYVPSGDGYVVHLRERAVCSVHTKTSEFVPAHESPDGRQLRAEVVDKPLAHADWQFHFYHGFVTPTILKELLDLLPKPEPDHGRGRVVVPDPTSPHQGPWPDKRQAMTEPVTDAQLRSTLEAEARHIVVPDFPHPAPDMDYVAARQDTTADRRSAQFRSELEKDEQLRSSREADEAAVESALGCPVSPTSIPQAEHNLRAKALAEENKQRRSVREAELERLQTPPEPNPVSGQRIGVQDIDSGE